MVFAMADLHLSLSGQDKSMEIFGGRWHGYVDKIEKNWNKLVGELDSVVVPGDISWGQSIGASLEDFDFLNNRLNGTKYILKGNHDFWWDTAAKMARAFEEHNFGRIKIVHNNAYVCGDYVICGSRGWFAGTDDETAAHSRKIIAREAGRLELSLRAAKELQDGREIVAFLHYPPVWGGYVCEEIIGVLERAGISRCYFGHVHNIPAQKPMCYKNIRLELISADYLNFMPAKI